MYLHKEKKKQKIIRWNKADYIFPKGDWNYNAMVKAEHLSSNNKGIKENISDDQIKSVLNQLGFITFNKVVANIDTNSKKEETKTKGNYYCIWYDEYFDVYRFTHNKISPATCAARELFIVKEFEHKKLYNSLKWRFKNEVKEGDDPVAKVPKKLFSQVKEQIPKIIKTAEKEPSQTQDEEYIKWKAQSGEEKFTYKVIHTDTNKIFEGRVRGSTSRSTFVMAKEQAFLRCKNSNEGKKNPSGCVVYDKTQITKKEPSQTQGVATKDEEIYFACLNVMVKDRSTIDNFQPGEEYGFQYFKLDSNNSEITVHEQIYDDKPEKIGSIKIDFQGKKTVEFDIRRKEGTTIISDKFKLSSKGRFYKDDGYDNYSFEATTYVKTKSDVMDYDFKSKMCLPPKDEPPKDKKIYKKWIRSGY